MRLLVSDWMKKERDKANLQSLASEGVEVRIIHIPPWSGGDVPFARVAHARFCETGSNEAWIGTSNGDGDHFTNGRNVGVVVRGGPLPTQVHMVFEDGWRIATPP